MKHVAKIVQCPNFFLQKCVLFWGPMMFANFRLVPPTGRVAFVAFANLIWVNILCMCKRTSKQAEIIAATEIEAKQI